MPRSTREKSKTGTCHVGLGRNQNRPCDFITYYMEIQDINRKTTFRQAKRSIKNNRDRTSNGEDSIFETILEAPPIVALSAIGVGLLGAITGLLFDDGDSEDED